MKNDRNGQSRYFNQTAILREPHATSITFQDNWDMLNPSSKTGVFREQNKRKNHLRNSCKEQTKLYAGSLYFDSNLPVPRHKRLEYLDKFHDIPKENVNGKILTHYSGTSYIPSSQRYLCNNEYDFCICSVPKSGCTFWSQIFQVLGADEYSYDSIFNKPRILVHQPGFKYSAEFKDVVRNNTRTILIARDPYSRLYSAFIDKVYLPSSGNMYAKHILNRLSRIYGRQFEESDKCKLSNVTFQDFLTYVAIEARADTSYDNMNIHWRPISTLCRPCLVNPLAIVKQESFSEDVEHVLSILEIDSKKYDFLIDALHNRSSDIRMKELVRNFELFQRVRQRKRRKYSCNRSSEVASRLWHALKIQGYIDKSAPFPDLLKSFESENYYWRTVQNLIATIRDQYPMNSLEVKQQRRSYLVDAYKTIDKHTIGEIQFIYRSDFELYNYDTIPPIA